MNKRCIILGLLALAACDTRADDKPANATAVNVEVWETPEERRAREADERRRAEEANERQLVENAREALTTTLYDPSSAEFRRVRRVGNVLCGQVNAKNRFGAYVGFVDFVAEPNMVHLSQFNDGIATDETSDFALAFIDSCATPAQRRRIAEQRAAEERAYAEENARYEREQNAVREIESAIPPPLDPFAEGAQ